MPIPPEPILRGAVRWLERIPSSGVPRTRSLLVTNARFADLTPTQYESALAWLQRTGLVEDIDSIAPASVRVYQRAVSEAVWFADADAHIREPEELPQDALLAAAALNLNEEAAFQHLIAAWGRVDTEARELVGAAGEELLVNLLRESVSADVEQVSQWSDALGYDIAVTAPSFARHLEVKSSTRRGRLTVYLSRNEFNVMRRDVHWTLVALRLTPDLGLQEVRTVSTKWLVQAAPEDAGFGGRWESCRFDVPPEATSSGLAALEPVLHAGASPHLRA